MKIILTIIQWIFGIPLYFGIGLLLGGLAISAAISVNHYLDRNFLACLIDYQTNKEKVAALEKEIRAKKSELIKQESNLDEKKNELEEQIRTYQEKTADANVSQLALDNEMQNWVTQRNSKSSKNKFEQTIAPTILADITDRAGTSKFLKALKPYKRLMNTNIVSPIDVDEIRFLLMSYFTNKPNASYVEQVFNCRLDNYYNPIIVAWELYRLYGNEQSISSS